jgi:hypothetical protein
MRIRIHHTTQYAYDRPITSAVQVLRMTPRSDDAQHIARWRVETDVDGRLKAGEDSLGNLHALFHAFTTDPSPAPPQSCAGALVSAHAFSGDGGLSWARSDTQPFGNEVALSGGGGPLVVATRERPKLVLDAARTPIALFTGASAVQTCPPASCCGCKYDGWSFTLAQETEV